MENQYNGIVEDPRTEEQKAQDFQHSELAGAVPLIWKEKTKEEWKRYTTRNQDGSSSCCGQGSAKAAETLTGEVESAHPIYRSRANFPQEGMWLQDVGNIWRKIGSTTEILDPSQNMGEADMNRPITVPTPLKMGSYVFVNSSDIDAVAEAIEAHKHCIMIVHCNINEWTDVPVYNASLPVNMGHCVCAVDYFLYNGKKAILIEDSWGKFYGLEGARIITEDYLKARFDGAMYLVPPGPQPDNKPHHRFSVPLTFGMMNNADVRALQDILKYEGCFPASIASTGNMLQITCKGLKTWQIKHGIMDFANTTDVRKVRFGNKSIAEMNKIYA